jgi:hypothetical protein
MYGAGAIRVTPPHLTVREADGLELGATVRLKETENENRPRHSRV